MSDRDRSDTLPPVQAASALALDPLHDALFFEHGIEVPVLLDPAREVGIGGQEPAEPDEGAHDGDVDVDGAGAAQHAREHGDALLGEGPGRVFAVPAPAGF